MPSVPLHGLVVLTATAVTVAAGILLSRGWRRRHGKAAHPGELSTFVEVIGTLYAVLVAFVLLSVWDQYNTAHTAADREASQIADLVRLTSGLPEPSASHLRDAIREYAAAVADEEWTLMARGDRSPRAEHALDDLWKTLVATEPVGSRAITVHGQALERLRSASDSRQDRLSQASPSVHSTIWILLIGGAALTLLSAAFLETSAGIHLPMNAGLALMIAFILYLIFAFDHPFSHDVGTGPDAFRAVVDMVRHQ